MNTQLSGMIRIISPNDIEDDKVSFRTNGGIVADKSILACQDIKIGRRLYVSSNIFADVRFIESKNFIDTSESATTMLNTSSHDINFTLNSNVPNKLIQSFTNFNGPYNVIFTCGSNHTFDDPSVEDLVLEAKHTVKLLFYDNTWYNIS